MFKFLLLFLSASLIADQISLDYQLMDQEMFDKTIVGNTVIGITRQSQSLYMLHFLRDGYCELWKQNKSYAGQWWIEKDDQGRTIVRALWPEYTSSEPASLFCPQNPKYGTPTALRYYINPQTGSILIGGKNFIAPITLFKGLLTSAI